MPTTIPPEIRALELFDHFIELPPEALERALAKLHGEDPALHAALAALLHADSQSYVIDDALPLDELNGMGPPSGVSDREPANARLGSRLGAWQIERVLGVGGMGAVYLARRCDGHFDQEAAIKCLRKELTTPAVVEAFRNERSLLAKLNHPYIVPMLDGGIDEEGNPWFAMQRTDGIPIDQWCDQQALSLRQRIELFIQACDAIAYAHSQMVVHQDIKPSNLLVNADGRPKLLDFGLSALLTDVRSGLNRIAITSGYGAPESLNGARANARMDIFSLGILLYRLLCAGWPRKSGLTDALARNPLLDDPQSPSILAAQSTAEVAHVRRQRNPAALARALKGDLDSICLKCVAGDPLERYASVVELQMDLRAWLKHEPISIREGRLYRMGRHLRRNAIPLSLGSALVVSLGVGLTVTLWQSRRADNEAESARAINSLFEETLGSAALSGLSETRLNSRQLLENTETRLRAISASTSPVVMARGLSSLAKGYAAIGDYAHATQLAMEAQRLGSADALQSARNASTLATLLNLQNRFDRADQVATAALAKLEDSPRSSELRERIPLRVDLARARWGLADHQAALRILEQALADARTLSPFNREAEAELLTLRGSWKSTLLDLRGAEADLRQAIALADQDFPYVADSARDQLARMLRAMMRTEEGLDMAQTLVSHRIKRLGGNHPETGRAWVTLADLQQTAGQLDQARDSLRRGEDILRTTLGPHSPEMVPALMVDSTDAITVRGDYRTGISLARQAAFIAENAYGAAHPTTLAAKTDLAFKLNGQAVQDPQQADRWYAEATRLHKEVIATAQEHRLPVPIEHLSYAMTLISTGRPAEAERELAIAGPLIRKHFGPRHGLWMGYRYLNVNVLLSQGREAEAETQLDAVIRDTQALPASRLSKHILLDAYELKGRMAFTKGDSQTAMESWRHGLAIARSIAPESPRTQRFDALLLALDTPESVVQAP